MAETTRQRRPQREVFNKLFAKGSPDTELVQVPVQVGSLRAYAATIEPDVQYPLDYCRLQVANAFYERVHWTHIAPEKRQGGFGRTKVYTLTDGAERRYRAEQWLVYCSKATQKAAFAGDLASVQAINTQEHLTLGQTGDIHDAIIDPMVTAFLAQLTPRPTRESAEAKKARLALEAKAKA